MGMAAWFVTRAMAATIPAPPADNGQPPLPPQGVPLPLPRLREAALATANSAGAPVRTTVLSTSPGPAAGFGQPVIRSQAVGAPTGLSFDALVKSIEVTNGAPDAVFSFGVTNISKEDITILSAHTSCGCTAAKLPQQPWVLHPGDHGEVGATMHVAGKWGTVTKTLTIATSQGNSVLTVRSILPEANSVASIRMSDRSRNLQIAAADRQAVFRGDCAKCHVEPTVAKMGQDLYVAACGVCHDAENKATMVPALVGRAGTFDEAYWNTWVRNGKVGTLMPAFEMKQGGPLSDEQVKSLTAYLANEFVLTSAVTPSKVSLPQPGPVK